jgi:hypothetical protein
MWPLNEGKLRMKFQYHYCANSRSGAGETVIDGVATVSERVQTLEQYRQFKALVCGDVMNTGSTHIVSLTLLGIEADLSTMQAAFEAKYQRDWDDPASDEMKAIWADAWAAAKASA